MADLTNMKVDQTASLPPFLLEQSRQLGQLLSRLRVARGVKQTDAAARAGLSRNTVYRLEHGDPGLAVGQIFRYLEGIAPGTTLESLYEQKDPALLAQAARERRTRVSGLSAAELDELNF
ncbi:helix-turn-helix transcriptional regulator [Caballeronia sp. J97]|uniref:helix-turn-helix domain-containing protein n=1 Tax=Caballeronia sp. J97 TaxID=2805429 RepID=UPI002AB03E85|nr:helix-turn-helix transcriptional regulator [Caballeronia sp. J97]